VYVQILSSSGSNAYDENIESTVRSTWRFRSLRVDGAPVPVCTDLIFIYSKPKAAR